MTIHTCNGSQLLTLLLIVAQLIKAKVKVVVNPVYLVAELWGIPGILALAFTLHISRVAFPSIRQDSDRDRVQELPLP